MAGTPLAAVVRHLRRLAVPPHDSDDELLRRFAAGRDEAAFARLVERHGPLVLGVCRRVLRDADDSDDAFQATFFVLARKAAAVRRAGSLANWLYRVAYRIALRARAERVRRHLRERQGRNMRRADEPAATWDDLRPVLDEELQALPDKYRLPVVLCYLEGRTLAQAAADLGWPRGTVAGRLARARDLLRERLTRRGVVLSAGLLGSLLAEGAASATVPPALAGTTAKGATLFAAGTAPASVPVSLAEAALRALTNTKVRALAALLVGLTVLAVGTGLLARPAPTAPPHAAAAEPRPAAGAKADAQGDPLPMGAIARLGTLRWRHEGMAWAAAFAPDGKTLAVSCSGCQVFLFDTATGQLRRRLRPAPDMETLGRLFMDLAFSPDGKLLAADCCALAEICLWDVATGRLVHRLSCGTGLDVWLWGLHCSPLHWTPDGKAVVVTRGQTVAFHDAITGEITRAVGDNKRVETASALSPDGKLVAIASRDSPPQLWDVATGKLLRTLGEHKHWPYVMAFSPDGKILAAGGPGLVLLSEVGSGKELGRIEFKRETLFDLAFTNDGKTLVGGGTDGHLRVWDVATRRERHVLDIDRLGRSLALSPDGKTVAMGSDSNTVRLWDLATGKERFPAPAGHRAPVQAVAFSPDGQFLVSGDKDAQTHLWNAADGRRLRRLGGTGAYTVSFAPDGKRLVTARRGDKTVRVFDMPRGEEVLRLPHDGINMMYAADFALGGKAVMTLDCKYATPPGRFGTTGLHVWDAATGKQLHDLWLQECVPTGLAVSPDGQIAAVSAAQGRPGASHLYDIARGKELLSLRGQGDKFAAAAFSPDGTLLASTWHDQLVRLWEVVTGREVAALKGSERGVAALTFLPGGRVLVCGEGGDDYGRSKDPPRIRFWDVATGRELATLEGHDSTVLSLAVSPDGKRLASGLENGTVLLWDVPPKAKAPPLPAKELGAKDLAARWADLADEDAAKAHAAVYALAASPGQAVPFLKGRLRPAAVIDPKQMAGWLADLDADDFDVRDRAANRLFRLGAQVEPELRKALAAKPSAVVRRQVEAILKAMDGPLPAELLRALRAVRALEAAGTPEAQKVLEAVAKGAPGAQLTTVAAAAVGRLTKRTPLPEKK